MSAMMCLGCGCTNMWLTDESGVPLRCAWCGFADIEAAVIFLDRERLLPEFRD